MWLYSDLNNVSIRNILRYTAEYFYGKVSGKRSIDSEKKKRKKNAVKTAGHRN